MKNYVITDFNTITYINTGVDKTVLSYYSTAADVSSHDDSIPKIVIFLSISYYIMDSFKIHRNINAFPPHLKIICRLLVFLPVSAFFFHLFIFISPFLFPFCLSPLYNVFLYAVCSRPSPLFPLRSPAFPLPFPLPSDSQDCFSSFFATNHLLFFDVNVS